jgi:hypothetical protein
MKKLFGEKCSPNFSNKLMPLGSLKNFSLKELTVGQKIIKRDFSGILITERIAYLLVWRNKVVNDPIKTNVIDSAKRCERPSLWVPTEVSQWACACLYCNRKQ